MSEWNERVERAKQQAFKHCEHLVNANDISAGDVRRMFRDFANIIKEPEPAEKKPEQALVKDPNGNAWMMPKEDVDKSSFNQETRGIHLTKQGCGQFCRPATRGEAFCDGAIVRYTKGDFVIQGKAEMQDGCLSIIGGKYQSYGYGSGNLTLVKPAPEGES